MQAVNRRGRALTATLVVILVSVTTTACAGRETVKAMPEKTTNAREGRDRVVELVINTTKQLDVTDWWPRNGVAWAQECSLGRGEKGASYGYDHWAPQGTDHIGDAKRVADYWKSLGMTRAHRKSDNPPDCIR